MFHRLRQQCRDCGTHRRNDGHGARNRQHRLHLFVGNPWVNTVEYLYCNITRHIRINIRIHITGVSIGIRDCHSFCLNIRGRLRWCWCCVDDLTRGRSRA